LASLDFEILKLPDCLPRNARKISRRIRRRDRSKSRLWGHRRPRTRHRVVRSFMYRVAARPGDVDAGLPVVVWSQPR
jgi:hypothetical protein